ncbi:MAG: HoxN/HupN/NixA family nickel/cobalt transporter [Alphaproteobacteria bacterium]|nr:HoxN/HupN/NixA family nickel/cobalt transporter [Alphaproteobacteria bacterium]
MVGLLSRSRRCTGALRRRITGIYALLTLINLFAWAWAVLVFRHQPVLLGTAFLAYGFGLRHAVDADHLAAIDNATRKLMQQGRRPVGVGLYFALGHSSVVILAAAAVAATATALAGSLDHFKAIGSLVGTGVSAFFLFAIAAANLIILRGVWRTFQQVRKGGRYIEKDFDLLLNDRGLLTRLFRPLFRVVGASWHMYPIGFLFGLGFDTATEVALLAISAAAAAKGVSIWAIMVFPALFAAGMSLIDTTDGILMVRAYDWAFVNPIRKLYYNLTITFLSVLVAVLIGSIEVLGLMGDRFALSGGLWNIVGALNDHFSALGIGVVVVFIAVWAGSVIVYRYKRLDKIELAPGDG